jgi:hypothetical protein
MQEVVREVEMTINEQQDDAAKLSLKTRANSGIFGRAIGPKKGLKSATGCPRT